MTFWWRRCSAALALEQVDHPGPVRPRRSGPRRDAPAAGSARRSARRCRSRASTRASRSRCGPPGPRGCRSPPCREPPPPATAFSSTGSAMARTWRAMAAASTRPPALPSMTGRPRRAASRLALALPPSAFHGLGGRADEDQPGRLDGADEGRAFRQEAVARMDRVGADPGGCGEDGFDVQVARARRGRAPTSTDSPISRTCSAPRSASECTVARRRCRGAGRCGRCGRRSRRDWRSAASHGEVPAALRPTGPLITAFMVRSGRRRRASASPACAPPGRAAGPSRRGSRPGRGRRRPRDWRRSCRPPGSRRRSCGSAP